MNCPKCGSLVDAKGSYKGEEYVRYCKCVSCGHRFQTVEVVSDESRKTRARDYCTLGNWANPMFCNGCDKCGWSKEEMHRRKALLKENGLETNADGLRRLVI